MELGINLSFAHQALAGAGALGRDRGRAARPAQHPVHARPDRPLVAPGGALGDGAGGQGGGRCQRHRDAQRPDRARGLHLQRPAASRPEPPGRSPATGGGARSSWRPELGAGAAGGPLGALSAADAAEPARRESLYAELLEHIHHLADHARRHGLSGAAGRADAAAAGDPVDDRRERAAAGRLLRTPPCRCSS